MLCILSNTKEPYYNLAAEEFLFRNSDTEACMLWQSSPALIIGKHQNTYAEINYRYAWQKKILVARRLTGGGTVFHDPGNLNFSFIRQGEPDKLINFLKHIQPVIDFLKSYGIDARPGPKNEILAGNAKISGNAEHIFKNRILHHGTLLFNSDLDALNEAIARKGGTYNDKAVRSNRSNVTNLNEFLPPGITIDMFIRKLNDFLIDFFSGKPYAFQTHEEKTIQNLARSKYSTWNWIYGWSPDYVFRNDIVLGKFKAHIHLQAHRGIIREFYIESAYLSDRKRLNINSAFKNIPHEHDHVEAVLKACGFQDFLKVDDWDDLVFSFF